VPYRHNDAFRHERLDHALSDRGLGSNRHHADSFAAEIDDSIDVAVPRGDGFRVMGPGPTAKEGALEVNSKNAAAAWSVGLRRSHDGCVGFTTHRRRARRDRRKERRGSRSRECAL
jgi:hypothetical protein